MSKTLTILLFNNDYDTICINERAEAVEYYLDNVRNGSNANFIEAVEVDFSSKPVKYIPFDIDAEADELEAQREYEDDDRNNPAYLTASDLGVV